MFRWIAAAGVAAMITISVLAVPTTASTQSCSNGFVEVWAGANYTSLLGDLCWGTSANLSGSWNNSISSLSSRPGSSSKGFIFWTGPSYTDASWKFCGNTDRTTMPSGFDNSVSSYQSTSICPQ
jgi:hypothetical protein